jgi:hypothetical protein
LAQIAEQGLAPTARWGGWFELIFAAYGVAGVVSSFFKLGAEKSGDTTTSLATSSIVQAK